MRYLAALVGFLLVCPTAVLAQQVDVRVTAERAGGQTFEVTADWALPLAGADTLTAPLTVIQVFAGGHDHVSHRIDLPALAQPIVRVLSAAYDEVSLDGLSEEDERALEAMLLSEPVTAKLSVQRKRPTAVLGASLMQFDAATNTLRRYRRLLIDVQTLNRADPQFSVAASASQRVTESALATGTWFKLPIPESGVYRIDRAYIESLNLNPGTVDPARVQVYHNGGRILPALNSDSRPVDLVETPSFVRGGGDGRFDAGDEVVFYATGPRDWIYDADRTIPWRSTVNPYSTQTHAFIRVDGTNAVRVEEPAFPNFTAPTVLTETIGRFAVEEERIMLLQDFSGSGLEWFGPSLDSVVPSRTVLDATPPGLANGTATIRSRVLASSNPRATFTYRAGSATATASPRTILIANQQGFIATEDNVEFTTDVQAGTPVRVDLQYSGPSIGKGWIDWVELFYPQRLQPENGYLRFTTPAGETAPLELQLSGFSETPQVWDVTESGVVRRLAVQTGGAGFRVQLDPGARPRELVAFVPAGTRSPEAATPVANQNLHSLSAAPDFVIVAPEVFLEPARELAEHRRRDGLTVEVAEVEQIYNEFSGGTPDMRAVRDYFRFLYTLDAGNLQYALLFGDGHYDFRGIEDSAEDPLGPNHVLPYETERTILQEASYTSDDYFGLLDDNEGVWAWPGINGIRPFQGVVEAMDIGIGRIPARTIEEARGVVAKIKHYESPETQGRWRTRYTFVADDEYPTTRGDGDLHTQNADVVAEDVSARFPEMKIDKVYAISYPAESTPNGQQQVPEATRAVVRLIDEQGSLLWNYSGHGGYAGLADEDLLTLEDIELLNNFDKLTTFVTATCSFGKFDMNRRQSGAEALLLKSDGGAVALMTTVRLVVTSPSTQLYNLGLNLELNQHLFTRDEQGLPRRLGDVMRITKNSNRGLQGNNRKFNLLGDPTMRLGLPRQSVDVTRVGGIDVNARTAPLQALGRVEIEGEVRGFDGMLDVGYNGVAELSVFDAAREVPVEVDGGGRTTLPGNAYDVQNDLIYQGKVRVEAGRFKTSFVVPKDISYRNRAGRVAVYVQSEERGIDGFGATANVIVGGTSDNPVQDADGPDVNLYLNDDPGFVSGSLTTPEPTLVVDLNDDTGLNTTGTGVGHEMLLVINGDQQAAQEIGDRFEGRLDEPNAGTVRVRLSDLEPGPNTVEVKAWDVVNNSTTATLDFTVAESTDLDVRNVYNYPNPTLGGPTRFFFEHNQPPGTPADVELRIYTISGRLIRVIEPTEALPTGVLPGGPVSFTWDGRDTDLDPVATGAYLFKIRVAAEIAGGDRSVYEEVGRLAVLR